MYSAPIGEYEVAVYRIVEDGRRAPVPDIQSYMPELDPAGPVRMRTDYSPARVERNYEALVHRLAADRGDGATYVASIDWLISSKAQPGHREIRYRDGS
jgi:hypothetical protein